MTRPKLILCVGLQRSGNHAVLGWVESLFPGTVFHNDEYHDLPADEGALRARLATQPPTQPSGQPSSDQSSSGQSSSDQSSSGRPAPCTIISFEDSANRTRLPGRPLLESLAALTAPLPGGIETACEVHRLVILRDPYNTWASRVAANARAAEFGRPLTSDASWDLYRTNWLALADLDRDPAWTVILFNRWSGDAAYRRAICARLGGSYSEATLDSVSHRGGGSSFEGVPRPGYGQMLRQFPKYLSGPFLRRLAAKPGYYVKRFLAPPARGSDMEVERRWTTLIGRPEAAELFQDRDLKAATLRIFGPETVPPATA